MLDTSFPALWDLHYLEFQIETHDEESLLDAPSGCIGLAESGIWGICNLPFNGRQGLCYSRISIYLDEWSEYCMATSFVFKVTVRFLITSFESREIREYISEINKKYFLIFIFHCLPPKFHVITEAFGLISSAPFIEEMRPVDIGVNCN